MSKESRTISELAVNETVMLSFDPTPFLFKQAVKLSGGRYDYEVTIQCIETGSVQSILVKSDEIKPFKQHAH